MTKLKKLHVAQVGALDTAGSRFNGADLHRRLVICGHDSRHVVWKKLGADPWTYQLGTVPVRFGLYYGPRLFEKLLSFQSLFSLVPLALRMSAHFRTRDIIHYHIIYSNFFSIAWLPYLTRAKPSVWTLHDMWALTGHCTCSYECERWKTGCGKCPDLEINIRMRHDRTAAMWNIKQKIYSSTDIDLIVASKWMLDKVRESPLLHHLRVHHIPFGIDTDLFFPHDKEEARTKLGIARNSIVVGFRSSLFRTKALKVLKECLAKLSTRQPVTLVTFDQKGLLEEFRGRYHLVELGWLVDIKLMAEAYSAMDVFVIPSLAESFNLMAIEAMSCGTPIVAFEKTAVPDVIFRDEAGIVVPYADGEALARAIERLADNADLRITLGQRARQLAVQHYRFEDHVDKIIAVYREVIARRRSLRS